PACLRESSARRDRIHSGRAVPSMARRQGAGRSHRTFKIVSGLCDVFRSAGRGRFAGGAAVKNEATILENDLRRFFAVRRLSYFVKRFYGEDHPTSKAIAENLADASHANLHFPSQPMTKVAYAKYVASLAKATSIYKQLGPNERRAIFNGWNARDPMMGWPEDSNYKPVPFLDFDPLTSDGLIITGDYGEWHRGNAVTLRIKEG